jgi:hypothetical protein
VRIPYPTDYQRSAPCAIDIYHGYANATYVPPYLPLHTLRAQWAQPHTLTVQYAISIIYLSSTLDRNAHDTAQVMTTSTIHNSILGLCDNTDACRHQHSHIQQPVRLAVRITESFVVLCRTASNTIKDLPSQDTTWLNFHAAQRIQDWHSVSVKTAKSDQENQSPPTFRNQPSGYNHHQLQLPRPMKTTFPQHPIANPPSLPLILQHQPSEASAHAPHRCQSIHTITYNIGRVTKL